MAKFLFFLIYTISIFFIDNWVVLGILFLVNILVTVLLKIDLKRMINSFLLLLPFFLITILINILFESLNFGILIGIRLIMCYNITYIFSNLFSVMEFSHTIEKLCFPLKIFKVDTKSIGIMTSIGICMIPVFKNEMQDLVKSMNSKGKKLGIKNIVILMKPVFIQTFRKANQLEKTLIAKGYTD